LNPLNVFPAALVITIRESRKRLGWALRRKHSRNHRLGSLFFCRAFFPSV